MAKENNLINTLINKVKGIFGTKVEEKQRIDISKVKASIDLNKEEAPTKKIAPKAKKTTDKKVAKKEPWDNKRYWMLVGHPDKWFGDKNKKNATVNKLLLELTEGEWEISKALSKNIKKGDLGVLKLGNDTRSKERRTYRSKVYDKLESGVYATIEFTGVYETDDKFHANFKVLKNLFKDNKLILKDEAEKTLGKVNRDKEIDKTAYIKINDKIEA